jgi:hypothetical protein
LGSRFTALTNWSKPMSTLSSIHQIYIFFPVVKSGLRLGGSWIGGGRGEGR